MMPFPEEIDLGTLQPFPDEERDAAADALASRLGTRGLLVSGTHRGCDRPGRAVHALEGWVRKGADKEWPYGS